jgi:hypothetical protein
MSYFGLVTRDWPLILAAYIGTPMLLLVFSPLWLLVPERPERSHGGLGGGWRVRPLLAKAQHRLGRGGGE